MPLVGTICCQTGEPRDFDECIHEALFSDRCKHMAPLIIAMKNNVTDRKDAGRLSATALLGCARFNAISPEFEYYEDPEAFYDRFRGTISHAMVEQTVDGYPDTIVERRVGLDVLGTQLTGKMDLVVPTWTDADGNIGLVADYKSTNKRVTGIREPKPEHVMQVNIYAYLLRNGYFLDTGEKVDVNPRMGMIRYVEMKGYKTFTFPLMWEQDQDELVELLVAENVGWTFPEALPPVLLGAGSTPNWKCTRCPLRAECDALAEQYGSGRARGHGEVSDGDWDNTDTENEGATFKWEPYK